MAQANTKIDGIQKSPFSTTEAITPYKDVTNYNNYYEFSTDKYEPAGLAKNFKTRPWTVTIDGEVKKKQVLDVDDHHKNGRAGRAHLSPPLRGRLVHRRALGGVLAERIDQTRRPLCPKRSLWSSPRFSICGRCRASAANVLQWPYVEGLRMDEAMHPLALLCFGMYGEVLPNQDGAPPAHGDSLEIRLQEHQEHRAHSLCGQPTRQHLAYFRAQRVRVLLQCEPQVDHPRWSQATERRLGEFRKRPTLMFNGYDQVASLYSGMDLKKNF